MARYEVTLERGRDGTYLAWVNELPGCAVRAHSRDEVLERLPDAIAEFLAWDESPAADHPEVAVVDEVDSLIDTEEDTEALVSADRSPLTEESWAETRRRLARSRDELVGLLERLSDDELTVRRMGSSRTVREEIAHVAFVELMYAAWTFDLQSPEGLASFLDWTRAVALERLDELTREESANLTWAEWSGAPRPEPWSPRKAARRLLWHELLHLRAVERVHDS